MTSGLTWRQLQQLAAMKLQSSTDARRLVERASGFEGAEYFLHLDRPAGERAAAHLESMVERRAVGEPLQYVLGRWSFRTLDLLVDRRVLIPRPETETVVDVALAEARRLLLAPNEPLVAVDLGTGSGAIGLSLAAELPQSQVWITDVSPDAVDVARANLAGAGSPATRVQVVQGSWYAALPDDLAGRVRLLVSNPPYIGAAEELPPEVADWEPRDALVAGTSGLEALRDIVAGAPRWLARPGVLVVEVAPHQADAVVILARDAGFTSVDVRPDLVGRARAVVARR